MTQNNKPSAIKTWLNHKVEPWVETIETTMIVFLLGMMAIMTFANVIARFVFNSNIFWALELSVFMFAWMVLIGASFAVKKSSHLGVDALINYLPPAMKRRVGLFAVIACILYSALLLKGGWDYWAPFANLPPTTGRWIPTGFADNFRGYGWYETNDIPIPFFMRWLEVLLNGGEPYERMPKAVPYIALPIAAVLLLFRFCQAAVAIWQGRLQMVIVNHELEDAPTMTPTPTPKNKKKT